MLVFFTLVVRIGLKKLINKIVTEVIIEINVSFKFQIMKKAKRDIKTKLTVYKINLLRKNNNSNIIINGNILN